MAKPSAKQKSCGVPGSNSAASTAPQDANCAAGGFRSPVGCTGATPGEKEFLAWCQEERVRFPSSHLTVLPDTGRALVASRNIKMGEVVVEVPDDAVLMADNCSIREILEEEGMCKPADDEILEIQGLIIAVMYEKSRGKESRWEPYLSLIPDDMTHMPLYWKRSEFRELRGTAAYDKMMGRVQHPADAPTQIPVLWSEVVEPFIREHPELGMPAGKEGYDLYRWATCAVASYSFILGDDKYQAMVPVWDLLNHITGRVNVRLYHCAKRHLLQMIATRDIPRGQELVNNYGELSNAELLRGYGFVEERNRNNHVQVPLGFVVRAATELLQAEAEAGTGDTPAAGPGPGSTSSSGGGGGGGNGGAEAQAASAASAAVRRDVAARLRLAQRCGLLPQHHVFKVFADRPPPTHMTALMYLLLAPYADAAAVQASANRAVAAAAAAAAAGQQGADGRKQKGKGRSRLGGKAAAQARAAAAVAAAAAGGEAALARVARVYGAIVERMLGRYGSGLEEDERLLARREALPPRLYAAVLARKPEKEALLSLREAVRRKGALHRSLVAGSSGDGAVKSEGGGKAFVAGGGGEASGGAAEAEGRAKGATMPGTGASHEADASGRFAAAQFAFGFQV
ncbi:hypothetical protein PLESTB_000520300 [Pleodorina starrii]|uniref:SET domain-containing protein n=1 Tax=Pleodorina starrii TaxID=330485 RepID=A0A9W6BGH7_9CHLO|nr:hypothetical protein PLESTM_000383700 [Pleodorina starrii]GLC51603.1 hypothetical protein PLESTB_000520300 [Pleodorina starrii]GLC72372.1 hypothetical protein PLESTF_001240600 [Pleodorina starrii]